MNDVGKFEMATAFHGHNQSTAIHKQTSPEEWPALAEENLDVLESVALSAGISEQDQTRVGQILTRVPEINLIYIDVS